MIPSTFERYQIIQVTPSRIDRQAGISIISGINIPHIWHNYVPNNQIHRPDKSLARLKWVSEAHDLRSLPKYLKNKDYDIFQWIKTYKRVKAFEVLSTHDLLPFISLVSCALSRFVGKLIKHIPILHRNLTIDS